MLETMRLSWLTALTFVVGRGFDRTLGAAISIQLLGLCAEAVEGFALRSVKDSL